LFILKHMKIKSKLVKGLARLIVGISIISGLNGCTQNYQSEYRNQLQNAYQRIKSSKLSEEDKKFVKNVYQSTNMNNLSEEDKIYLSKYSEKMNSLEISLSEKKMIEDFYNKGIIDPNNLSETDLMFLKRFEGMISSSSMYWNTKN